MASVNVANLSMARNARRGRELVVRGALGASRVDLVKQLIIESCLAAFVGGLVGVFMAHLGVGALLSASPGSVPRVKEITPDVTLLAFSAFATMLTVILFGVGPALKSTSNLRGSMLSLASRTTTGSAGSLEATLLTAQVALSLVLLIGSTLLMKSFISIQAVELGIDAPRALTFGVHLGTETYQHPEQRVNLHKTFQRELASEAGIDAVGASSWLPLQGPFNNWSFRIEQDDGRPGDWHAANFRVLEGNYFDALGVGMRGGADILGR